MPIKTRKPTKDQRRQGFLRLTNAEQQSLVKWGARLHIKGNNGTEMNPIHILPS